MWPFKKKDVSDDISIEDTAKCLCVLIAKAGSVSSTCSIHGLTYRGVKLGNWTVTVTNNADTEE